MLGQCGTTVNYNTNTYYFTFVFLKTPFYRTLQLNLIILTIFKKKSVIYDLGNTSQHNVIIIIVVYLCRIYQYQLQYHIILYVCMYVLCMYKQHTVKIL